MTNLKNQLQNKANNTNQVKKASPSKGMEQLLTKWEGKYKKHFQAWLVVKDFKE